jgi:hypothetical protein
MTQTRAILVQTIRASFLAGTRKSVDVEIYELCTGLNVADLRGFRVQTSTGYVADFPEVHTECTRIVCVKHDAFTAPTKESGTHCHGLHHLTQVVEFAREVAKTYGDAAKVPRTAKAPAEWTPARFDRLVDKITASSELAGPSGVTAEWLG